MTRNYKYKLYASKNTKFLSRLITSSNFAWNHVVDLARRYYKLYGRSISCARMQKHMAKLAKNDRFWKLLDSQTMQAICQKYAAALDQHFKQKKRGFPRNHKEHCGGGILFKQSGYSLCADDKGRGVFVVRKLKNHGTFRFKITRPWGKVKNVTVKRDNDGCLYIVVCCEVPETRAERAEDKGAIGIDFGMKVFITTSDGEEIAMPDYHKEALEKTRKADASYSRKRNAKVYGTSFKRARKAKHKAHRKVADKRSDFHWKLAHRLCREHSYIAIEDLNMEGMKRHRRWGRKISSLGWGEFVQKLTVVAEKYGTEVVRIGRFEASTQTCSECGYRNPQTKDLSVREWVCPECGAFHHRDVNAARNILAFSKKDKCGKGISRGHSDGKTNGVKPGGSRVDGKTSGRPKNPATSVAGVCQQNSIVFDTPRLINYWNNSKSFTWSILIKKISTATYQFIIGYSKNGDMPAFDYGYSLHHLASYQSYISSAQFDRFTITYCGDNNVRKIYKNNTLLTSTSPATTWMGAPVNWKEHYFEHITLAASIGGNYITDAYMKDARMYNRELTAEEVAQL